MLNLIKKFLLTLIIISFIPKALGEKEELDRINPDANESSKMIQDADLEKLIKQFHSYAQKIPQNIREEVKAFRTKVLEINKKKQDLYNRMTQEAQNYLLEEQKYKKQILKLKRQSTDINKNDTILTK